jgi:tRNA uridine 5-carboxymethylaminomethyl modification enzyme
MKEQFDVIVIGAGHAGCEAALATSKMGLQTLLFTLNFNNIAFMPCNPSIGGPAKGNLVREIDALGGAMGRVIDRTYLQMRLLNTQKGPAVWAIRAQADKLLYQLEMRAELERQPNLIIREAEVDEILLDANGKVNGATTRTGLKFLAPAVILATGTFLNGRIFIGKLNYSSGPMGFLPALGLSQSLSRLGLQLQRFKTGTPARVRRRSLDFSKMTPQPGGYREHGFSFWEPWEVRPEHLCWLTYTQPETHRIIKEHLHEAALFSGEITGVGPRYCPSIEGKLMQFPDKDRHQVFIEPEGADTDEMYLAGLSTSLPETVQELFLRTVPGLENLEIVRPGYAIEYDYLPGDQLKPSLETKQIPGLYTAGQINGSSGYEEAAAQGLLAGINAALNLKGKAPLVLKRSEAYMGVLIDDLVTKESQEPYRIMTSRAEFRLTLRSDNADERLTPYGIQIGLIDKGQKQTFESKYKRIDKLQRLFEQISLNPDAKVRQIFIEQGLTVPKNKFTIADILKRPEIGPNFLTKLLPELKFIESDANEISTRYKYQGYLEKEREQAKRLLNLENKTIPEDLNYDLVTNLASEAREKLVKFRPGTLGQAARISGINPADLTALLFYLKKLKEPQ